MGLESGGCTRVRRQQPRWLRIGGFGPVDEGLIAFVAGLGVLVACTLWVGSRR